MKKLFKGLPAVPGRFELIKQGQPFKVIVDYAHTPDGLKNIMQAVRRLRKKEQGRKRGSKIILLFGCGGDRDRGKRAQMARLACRYSDLLMLTSDNPRTENPEVILRDIEQGLTRKIRRRSNSSL